MKYETILYSESDGVAEITLNRPEQLNALNSLMMGELIHALEFVHDRGEVRSVILTGTGRAFMAGADLKEYVSQTQEQFESFQNRGRRIYSLIENNRRPIIAAVNGYAFGGGMEIVLACDLVIAIEGAQMGLPEIKLGLIPGGGGPLRLAERIGLNRTRELLFTGRSATAEELLDWGLVNRIVPASALLEVSRELALDLAQKDPDALQALKHLVHSSRGEVSEPGLSLAIQQLSRLYQGEPAQLRLKEFLRKSEERSSRRKKESGS